MRELAWRRVARCLRLRRPVRHRHARSRRAVKVLTGSAHEGLLIFRNSRCLASALRLPSGELAGVTLTKLSRPDRR